MPKRSRWQRLRDWAIGPNGWVVADDPDDKFLAALRQSGRIDGWGNVKPDSDMDPDEDRVVAWLELLRAQDFEDNPKPTKQIGREELTW